MNAMKVEQFLGLTIPIVFAAMMALELRYTARPFDMPPRWRLQGVLFFAMVLAVGSVAPLVHPLAWVRARPLLDLSTLGWAGIPLGLLASTFVGYWFHRAEHRLPWLWRAAHQLHHSALRVDIAGAFYTHPVEVLMKVLIGTTINLYVLGLSPAAASVVGLILPMLSMWQHWNIRTPRWLGYWIPRPESHVLHHERGVHARNYGDLPLWDMLFGTYLNPRMAWNGSVGFDPGTPPRLADMLLMRDVSQLDMAAR